MHIPDDVVAKAVIAKGQVHDHGGIGASMRAALEAVIDDLVELGRAQPGDAGLAGGVPATAGEQGGTA